MKEHVTQCNAKALSCGFCQVLKDNGLPLHIGIQLFEAVAPQTIFVSRINSLLVSRDFLIVMKRLIILPA